MQTAITNLDSYKIGHVFQYPKGTTKVYSNFTPRSNVHFKAPEFYKDNKVVWVGLQVFLVELNEIWHETFFMRDIDAVCQEITEFYAPFAGANGVNVDHFRALHKLGYLPIEIKALPEGSLVDIGVPVLTITNTLPEAYWLPNALETWMSTTMWKMPTSATIARMYRKILKRFQELTGSNESFMDWQIHDFCARGMGGIEDAARSGVGHLLSSLGTDNLPAVKLVNDVYSGKSTFVGGSVPATEHSVMCAGGKETELETFRRLITEVYPNGVVSIVSDTWNFWDVIAGPNSIATKLKDEILSRGPDALGLSKVVFRPDSGDPVHIICGHAYEEVENLSYNELISSIHDVVYNKEDSKYYLVFQDTNDFKCTEISEAEVKGAVECLWDTFGGTTNDSGYKTLNQKVGLIYGDSITLEREYEILSELMRKGFAADNIVFGVGSFTYQYVTRDTFGFAMKATYVEVDGVPQAIFKDPITDSGTKKSAKGLLRVEFEDGKFVLYDNQTSEQEKLGCLRTVYKDGEILVKENFADMRARLASFD